MKKAFTLIELVVAIGLLVMVISSAGMIFKISIETHRTVTANAEIMQKFRAITQQLNTDFQDIRKDAPLLIWFQQEKDSDTEEMERFDQIMFFSTGDFQSTQLYTKEDTPNTNKPVKYEDEWANQKYVRGNTARIYYGQAKVGTEDPWDMEDEDKCERILARRQHILTADSTFVTWPKEDMTDFAEIAGPEITNLAIPIRYNDLYEHDSLSLAQWKNVDVDAYEDYILDACFSNSNRSSINSDVPETFQRLMCEGVGSFAIQWAYWNPKPLAEKEIRWFPSDDPDDDPITNDSHFEIVAANPFGVLYKVPGGAASGPWKQIQELEYSPGDEFKEGFYPKALKFTFTIYDSEGIIEGGKKFTHIIYLSN